MIRMSPNVMSSLYGKDIIVYGTGVVGKRIIPYLAQDPTLKVRGVTNSRITAGDDGNFLDTGLPIRSVSEWARLYPDATILITSTTGIDEITAVCNAAGFQDIQLITAEMMGALIKMEDQIAESKMAMFFGHMCLANELHDAHKAAFSAFKGCNRGKTVAVVGTAPSLQHYVQIPGVPHVGVNASFLKEHLSLDYYFIAHYIPEWCERLKEYHFTKFFGITPGISSVDKFPEYIIEENSGRRFFSAMVVPGAGIHVNIECYPLMAFDSTIFPALHFALYTHPKKLLLVGCDCASTGHFDERPQQTYVAKIQIPQWIDGYREVKKFTAFHYPDTEIISVNPVGLKGMFRDVYTKSYLEAHPEIDRAKCEIIDDLW